MSVFYSWPGTVARLRLHRGGQTTALAAAVHVIEFLEGLCGRGVGVAVGEGSWGWGRVLGRAGTEVQLKVIGSERRIEIQKGVWLRISLCSCQIFRSAPPSQFCQLQVGGAGQWEVFVFAVTSGRALKTSRVGDKKCYKFPIIFTN